jgi:hypothetical protein
VVSRRHREVRKGGGEWAPAARKGRRRPALAARVPLGPWWLGFREAIEPN